MCQEERRGTKIRYDEKGQVVSNLYVDGGQVFFLKGLVTGSSIRIIRFFLLVKWLQEVLFLSSVSTYLSYVNLSFKKKIELESSLSNIYSKYIFLDLRSS